MLGDNPFSALSFIAGPALLTNASTVLLLGTINRYARALDRARLLASRLGAQTEAMDPEDKALLLRQLAVAQKRVLLIVRSLTAFYTAVGSFAFGTLAYLIGAASDLFAATFDDDGSVTYERSDTLDKAVADATRDALAKPGEGEIAVLLSPACASFDQFPNFEVRGDTFRKLVSGLPNFEPFGVAGGSAAPKG